MSMIIIDDTTVKIVTMIIINKIVVQTVASFHCCVHQLQGHAMQRLPKTNRVGTKCFLKILQTVAKHWDQLEEDFTLDQAFQP